MSESMHSLGKCLLTDLNTTVFTIRGVTSCGMWYGNYIHITLTVKAEKQTCFLGVWKRLKLNTNHLTFISVTENSLIRREVWWKSKHVSFKEKIWPLGARVRALGSGQLLQAQGRAVEEKTAASKQFLLHGWEAAPLHNKPQHLRGDTTPHFIFNFKSRLQPPESSFSTQIDSLDSGTSLKAKHFFSFSILKMHFSQKQTIQRRQFSR